MRRPTLSQVLFAGSATAAMAGAVAVPLLKGGSERGSGGPPKQSSWRRRITSHETFSHDSIDSLGFDWERIANPAIAPKYPLKIYLPRTTEDIVKAVREARTLGEKLSIRSKGHSSNDLVLNDGGSVLVTEKLNQVVELNEGEMTATVQSGTISAELDDWLAERGFGLPIIGDHNHITVGGFASVGGISPASHRFGLFLDNVVRLEYVTWDGDVVTCGPTHHPDQFYKVLAGLGQHGVMATLTVKIIKIDKYGTVLENDQTHYRNVDDFIEGSGKYIVDPGDALMERGVWIDFELPGGRTLKLGQFSAYKETDQSRYKTARNRVSYGYLHRIGYVAGRLPAKVDRIAKFVGTSGVLFSPKFATIKNIEFFTDKILDSTVGDPTRMFIILAPLEKYADLFRAAYEVMLDFRARHKCMTFISVYVKSITSPYLARGSESNRFCELMFYVGLKPENMTNEVLEDLVSHVDDICVAQGALRYMHSRTVKDEARRSLIDPNAFYARSDAPAVAVGD